MALAEVHVQFGVVGGQGEERADSGLPPLQPADYDRSRACCTSHRELHGYLQENVRSPLPVFQTSYYNIQVRY